MKSNIMGHIWVTEGDNNSVLFKQFVFLNFS